jgi:protein SCO1/2
MTRAGLVACAALVCILSAVRPEDAAQAGERKNRKSVESYVVPDVVLINQDGIEVNLRSLLQADRPVMLDFIYTDCTTTCPVLSAGYANVQRRLAPDTRSVQLVSISIDPKKDTPEVMKRYLEKYHAQPGWDFLTGRPEQIDQIAKAFQLQEMSFNYFTLVRRSPGDKWTKIRGLIDPTEMIKEYLR